LIPQPQKSDGIPKVNAIDQRDVPAARDDNAEAERVSPQARRTLFLLFLVLTLNIVDRQVINVLADPISQELDLSDTQLGLLTGLAFAIFYTLSGIPRGRLSDNPRTNRSWLIAGALSVWSTATALCGAANNYAHLLLARIGVAVSEAGCVPPGHS